jgi:hypothetical protein
VAEKGAQG